MNLSKYVAEFLYQNGVRTVFMLSGTGSIHLDDAFAYHKGLKYICARHEAAAVMMATGYAKLNGGLGVVIATTGPGGTNAVGGLVEAWVDSVPVVVISGQVPNAQMQENSRYFGVQGFNIVPVVQSMTKFSKVIRNPQNIRKNLEHACFLAQNGRPGPVWLDIPWDVQSADIDLEGLPGYEPPSQISERISNTDIEQLLAMLRTAKRPVVLAGQGIRSSHSYNEFIEFIERLEIPVMFSRIGLDLLSYSHHLNFGLAGMRGRRYCADILRDADMILGLATSLSFPTIGDAYIELNKNVRLVSVNIEEESLQGCSRKLDLSVKANIKDFLVELNLKLRDFPFRVPPVWLQTCSLVKYDNPTVLSEYAQTPINSYFFIKKLEEKSSSDAVFVSDAGSAYYITGQGLDFEEERRQICSGAFASMGVAVPQSIGCSCAAPERQILVVTGDGSIELNIQELKTISQNKLNIKVFVLNNGGYASIRESQDVIMGGRYTDDENILNFSNVAKAFELPFHLLENHKTLDDDLEDILSIEGPVLTEVVCDRKQEIIKIGHK